MRTTYLAIFAAAPTTIIDLKKILNETIDPVEQAEMERIATVALTNPVQVDATAFEKLFKEDGKQKAINVFTEKIKPLVDDLLNSNPDKEDLAWGVFEVMISDDFFARLNPDEKLDFNVRYDISLHPEGILLPNGNWTQDEPEEIMNEYKHGHIFVFFDIDY